MRIGWIYTSKDADIFLSSSDLLKIAKLQNENSIVHPCSARISKFVSVKAKVVSERNETGIDSFMVSDQCQALVRDEVFSGIKGNESLLLKKPGPNDVVPAVIYAQTSEVSEVPIDYFIVNLGNGMSKDSKDYNIIKYSDFPRENRSDMIQSVNCLIHNRKET